MASRPPPASALHPEQVYSQTKSRTKYPVSGVMAVQADSGTGIYDLFAVR